MLHLCMAKRTCLLLESARQWQQHGQQSELNLSRPVSLAQCVVELLAAKRSGNRRAVYVQSLAQYLNRFASGRGERLLVSFAAEEVESWLAQFPVASSRQTWLNRLSTLFSFAVRRGYLATNPCDRVERVTVDLKPPVILTPAQSRLLLTTCPTVCRPYLVLAMFAGIRPEEVLRMDWSQINLEAGTALVDGKTRRRRLVPLPAVAVAWLAQHPLRSGPVAPSHSTVRRWLHRARAVLGLPRWPPDVLRHTAASYLLARHQDAGKVALWLGNSPKILLSHYHEPVAAAACEEFWRGAI